MTELGPIDPPDEIREMLGELARAHRILEMEGHGDLSLGHMSLRDPHGRGLWLKRGNLGLEEVGEQDFILIDFDGRILEGDGLRHLEWPLHTEILRARPDLNVVGHTHPIYSIAMSATGAQLEAFSNEGVWFVEQGVPHYTGTSDLINTPDLGRAHAAALGDALAVFLRNHGAAFGGPDVKSATLAGVFLEDAARMQILLAQSGLPHAVPPREEILQKRKTIYPARAQENFWAYLTRKLARMEGNWGS
ncbi:MAG: class II aldolase/adducin family protein [Actinobacteria bacterium]|nr:class II aldolase/adducin family protein [Actinomycetota bacterium]